MPYERLQQSPSHTCSRYLSASCCGRDELKVLIQIQITSNLPQLSGSPWNSSQVSWTGSDPAFIEVFFHSLNKHKGRIHPLLKYSVSYPWPHTHPELWELFLGRPCSADHWVWCNISCVVESNQHQHFKRAEDRLHAASYCDFWEAQWGVKVAVFNLALNVKSKRIYPPDVFLCVCV